MGWKEYRKKRVKRYTFEDMDCPEFWVDIVGAEALEYGLTEVQELETVEEQKAVLVKVIVDWYITDPETDEPLPHPSEDDSVLNKLPIEFIKQIFVWATERLRSPDGLVPPQSGT